jgi:hypothetical protein
MSRRLAFARARWPVAVAMRVVAAALAADGPSVAGARRSVFAGPRGTRRVATRDPSKECAVHAPRGCEDLH